MVQAVIDYNLWHDRSKNGTRSEQNFTLNHVPMEVWLLVSLSTVLVVLINEAVKMHEIRYSQV